VKALARRVDVVLVIGSANSSNSNRLVEVAQGTGVPAYLVDDERDIDPAWLRDAETIGVTSGASAPEHVVERVVAFLGAGGPTAVEELRVAQEHVVFSLPVPLRPVSTAEPASGAALESV